jgi:glycosyltransferase involved in cell wall biosynthesis
VDLERIRADKPKAETKKQLGIEPDSPVIGTAGRLFPIKGIKYLLRASKIIIDRVQNLKVLIVGEGPERSSLQELTYKLKLDSHLIFTGHRDDVFNLISAMDIFVLPSLSEGIPMVLLEAMALRVAVVATNVGGIPEVLTNGQTGLLVPPRDENALANACRYFLENKKKAELITSQARRRVEECFSAESMVKNVTQIYESFGL